MTARNSTFGKVLYMGVLFLTVVFCCRAEERAGPILRALSQTTISGYADSTPQWNVETGVRGRSVVRACDSLTSVCTTNPYPTTIQVRTPKGVLVTRIRTGPQGRFRASLRPGQYTLIPKTNVTTNSPEAIVTSAYADPVHIVVPRSGFTTVRINYRTTFNPAP